MENVNFISPEIVFLAQLLGVVSVGGLIGEFYRGSVIGGPVNFRMFVASVMAGSFLAFLISTAFYYFIYNNRIMAFLVGGFISYQDERYIRRFIKLVIEGQIVTVVMGSLKEAMRDQGDKSENRIFNKKKNKDKEE